MIENMQIGNEGMPSLEISKDDLLDAILEEADTDKLKELVKNRGDDLFQVQIN